MERFYVYLITNLVNNKKYVGKSNKPEKRWKKHQAIAIGGIEKYSTFYIIHYALKKYGADNFTFEILEDFTSEKEAYMYETWWIEYFGSHVDLGKGYNCNYGGKGGIIPSKEVLNKLIKFQNSKDQLIFLSDLMKKRHKNNDRTIWSFKDHPFDRTGLKHSKETISKMSLSHQNTLAKGENHKNSKLTNKIIKDIRDEYNKGDISQHQLANKYKISQSSICNIIIKKTWKHI